MARLTMVASDGARVQSTAVDDPQQDDVVGAIASLSGQGEIYLGSPRLWLGVAGGPERFFVAISNDDEGRILQALADNVSGGPMEAIVGGQPTTLMPDYLVPIAVATAAALYFLATREALPAIAWDQM